MKNLTLNLLLFMIIIPGIAQVYDSGDKVGIGISADLERKLTINGGIDILGEGNEDVGILLYRPTESTEDVRRWILRANLTNNNSYPYLTNRTPNGKVVIKTGSSNGGSENTHLTFEGGDGMVKTYFENVYLGINKQNSNYPLHVYEKSGLGTTLCIDAESNANPNIMFQTNGIDQANIRVNDQDNKQLQFQVGSSLDIAMSINADGAVGIGSTNPNPNYKLSVDGKIRAKEVKVETGWSDFVFDDDYRLPSLFEVEQFIIKNKHLPDIPSAEEVEKNGLNLGEMESMLLQKIEELTLYVIDLKKENDQLKENIDLINKKVKDL